MPQLRLPALPDLKSDPRKYRPRPRRPVPPIVQDLLDEIEAKGYTDKQFCIDFRIASNSLTVWRSGRCLPSLDMLIRLSDALNVTPRLLSKG